MAKRATAVKRQRRERGSLNPDDILAGAFELAEQIGIDNLSMPMLGKHLDVGVTSIYWYFRKKDDLLEAMTERALARYESAVFGHAAPEDADWRAALRAHAHAVRKVFADNPILCDLLLVRAAVSPGAVHAGAATADRAVADLVAAGLPRRDALDTYAAIRLHVHGSVVLRRLFDKNDGDPATAPALGVPDDRTFEYGLNCILDHAARQLDTGRAPTRKTPAKKATAKRAPHARTAVPDQR
ncbi:TetR/AcrR family transcriptional regulator [Nocardia sp. NPDC003482]